MFQHIFVVVSLQINQCKSARKCFHQKSVSMASRPDLLLVVNIGWLYWMLCWAALGGGDGGPAAAVCRQSGGGQRSTHIVGS